MPPYEVLVDEKRHVLRATLHGFWDLATARGYIAALSEASLRVSRGGSPSWWLIDMSQHEVQSRDVAELMSAQLPSIFPPETTLAVVVAAALHLMQVKRVVPNENHGHFSTHAEANAWLADRGLSPA